MPDVEITIKLSEDVLRRAKAVGLQVVDLPAILEQQVQHREQQRLPLFAELADLAAKLPAELKLTFEEIEAEINAVRAEMAAERRKTSTPLVE